MPAIQNQINIYINTNGQLVPGSEPINFLYRNNLNRNVFYIITPLSQAATCKLIFKNTSLNSTGYTGVALATRQLGGEVTDKTASYYDLVKDWAVFKFVPSSRILTKFPSTVTGTISLTVSIKELDLSDTLKYIKVADVFTLTDTQAKALAINTYYRSTASLIEIYDSNTQLLLWTLHYNDRLIRLKEDTPGTTDGLVVVRALQTKSTTEPLAFVGNPSLEDTDFEGADVGDVSLLESIIAVQTEQSEAVRETQTQNTLINENLTALENRMNIAESDIENIEDGTTIVDKAKKDEYGNRISTHYATQNTLDDALNQIEVTGDIIAKKAEHAEKDGSGHVIKDNYATTIKMSYQKAGRDLLVGLYNFVKTGALGDGSPAVHLSKVIVNLPLADATYAGLLSASDKIKLDDLITTILGYVSEHDTDDTAHLYLRQLIGGLQSEIDRLDGKGRSYGMIDKTQSELVALGEVGRNSHILDVLQNKYTGYTLAMGDLIYTLTVSGQNEHEWEYNGTTWVDNGAWTVEKASNAEFGLVKGDSEYINIVSGIVEVLKAKTAIKLGTELEHFTHAMLTEELGNRYTKAEIISLIDQLKSVWGWEDSDLGTLLVNETISKTVLNDYDMVYLLSRANDNSIYETASFFPNQVLSTAVISVGNATFTQDATKWTFSGGYDVRVIGVKLKGLDAYQIDFGNSTVGATLELKADKIETRQIGEEIITYTNNKVTTVDSDTVTTTISYLNGEVNEITEFYKLDSKTYKTTFERDVAGNINKTTKELI